MRAVLLTAVGLEHAYVARCLQTVLGARLVGIIVENAHPSLRSALKRHNPVRLTERILTKVTRKVLRHKPRQDAALLRVLGTTADAASTLAPGYPTIYVGSVNQDEAMTAVARWEPTHLLVYGTGMVLKKMRSAAPLALNMHTGISPLYRGSDAEFWPLYDRRPECVGATVHVCTKDVDGGAIYATARATLMPGDDVFTAFAKSVEVGGKLYADVVLRMANGEQLMPTPQDFTLGRAYKFVDRTFVHDLWLEARTRFGGLL